MSVSLELPPVSVDCPTLFSARIETPSGAMIALADEHALHLLEFEGRRALSAEMDRMHERFTIVTGRTAITDQIEDELARYFRGELTEFATPLVLGGTDFQQTVWRALQTIPYGETWSYAELAEAIENPAAIRAVGGANGKNQLAIIVPCHRVINKGGGLGGYAGGLDIKRQLLELEARQQQPLLKLA
ncbi:MAG: methylated-DNA--[protein]-cysteine S-methyltransferase [Verrucomicrobiota bacterium]